MANDLCSVEDVLVVKTDAHPGARANATLKTLEKSVCGAGMGVGVRRFVCWGGEGGVGLKQQLVSHD